MAAAAAQRYPKVIDFWTEVLIGEATKQVYRHGKLVTVPKYSTEERFRASENLMAYGFGKPPQAIEAHFQEREHQTLEIRWMEPDPNDHSNYIAPEPD